MDTDEDEVDDDNPRPAAARLPATQRPAGSSRGLGKPPGAGTLTELQRQDPTPALRMQPGTQAPTLWTLTRTTMTMRPDPKPPGCRPHSAQQAAPGVVAGPQAQAPPEVAPGADLQAGLQAAQRGAATSPSRQATLGRSSPWAQSPSARSPAPQSSWARGLWHPSSQQAAPRRQQSPHTAQLQCRGRACLPSRQWGRQLAGRSLHRSPARPRAWLRGSRCTASRAGPASRGQQQGSRRQRSGSCSNSRA